MNRSFTWSMDIISSATKSGWPDSSSGKFFLVIDPRHSIQDVPEIQLVAFHKLTASLSTSSRM
jgi:hypothetical protein